MVFASGSGGARRACMGGLQMALRLVGLARRRVLSQLAVSTARVRRQVSGRTLYDCIALHESFPYQRGFSPDARFAADERSVAAALAVFIAAASVSALAGCARVCPCGCLRAAEGLD